MLEQVIFYSFATVLLTAALRVISVRNSVHAALYLVLVFFTCSALWILLRAEFLAIALVLVYVGAVMVLFLFVVMMLNLNTQVLREGFIRYLPLGVSVAVIAVTEMILVLINARFPAVNLDHAAFQQAVNANLFYQGSNTKALGNVLYTEYIFAFEIAAVVLLLAIVAAIVLTFQHRVNPKSQNPSKQVKVRREDRVRLVKMISEKKE